eukprot:GFUD01044386.1.p1 GENE.GFUD01044386.1~~GFUD01044386.1.p1  ORF type:complete len:573 (+),score=88.69 GFUD01044386.1:101-1720(+)
MASPGLFLRPTSLSIPINTMRSRSGSSSDLKIFRSISQDRPGTPRPQTGSVNTESFDFVRSNSGTHASRRSSSTLGSWDPIMSRSCSSGGLLSPRPGTMIRDLSPRPSLSRAFSGSALLANSSSVIVLEVEERKQVANLLSFEQIQKMEFYSKFTPTSVSLSHFLDHGATGLRVEESYLFLRREIPVRLANMLMELELLPTELLTEPACKSILTQYSQSFSDVLAFENLTPSEITYEDFNKLLSVIRHRHQDTVPHMAEALHNLRDAGNLNVNSKDRLNQAIQYFLDRLYMSRISIQMLVSQHKALYCPEESIKSNPGGRLKGTIDPKCDAVDVARNAFENATFLCEQIYMDAPKLNIEWVDLTDGGKDSVDFVYIPSHLYHMFFEVFKNSMRATMEFHENSDTIPEINVRIVKSAQDISIKVCDQGGGISRSVAENIFLYLYTSATRVKLSDADMGGTTSTSTPMHGLGYGLPLSRLYARYFGGDMKVASVDGYGTDTYIYLKALESDARETLPIFNASSTNKIRDTANQVEDWTKDE